VARTEQPFLVTTAARSRRDEQRERERRYLVTMAFRTLAFVLAIVLFGVHLYWAAGIAIGGSLILPWVAVVMANAGPRRVMESPALYQRGSRRALGGAERTTDEDDA
jgi:hypothetical protein